MVSISPKNAVRQQIPPDSAGLFVHYINIISDYLNALADAGFVLEKLVEQTDRATLAATEGLTDKMRQAQMFPLSFIVKARKGVR